MIIFRMNLYLFPFLSLRPINQSIFKINDYNFIKGDEEINLFDINGTNYLNISICSSFYSASLNKYIVEINVKKK